MPDIKFRDDPTNSPSPTNAAPPRRSALHQLRPCGVGTPYCESAFSYVNRLALSHGVSVYQLVQFVRKQEAAAGASLRPLLVRIDSPCANAAEFTMRLAELTRVPEVRFVGLGWLNGRSAAVEKLKSGLAWCTTCLREARELQTPVYAQTAWQFFNNRRCFRHDEPLVESCPHCGSKKDRRSIVKTTPLDLCDVCGHELTQVQADLSDLKVTGPTSSHWDRYTATQVGELLAKAPEIVKSAGRPDVARVYAYALEQGLAPSSRAFSRLAGVHSNAGYEQQEDRLLSIDLLTRLSTCAGVSLAGIFNTVLWEEKACVNEDFVRRAPRRVQTRDWNAIRARVERGISAGEELSIKSLSKEFGISAARIRERLGELGANVTVEKNSRELERFRRDVDLLVQRIVQLHRRYSYFGRTLRSTDVGREFGLKRGAKALNSAWQQFVDEHTLAIADQGLFTPLDEQKQ